MGFKDALENFYYGLEDRYYAVLDWLESKGLPVYKVIDPIDEVIPSFALFSLVVLLLVLGVAWLLLFSQPYYSINIKVVELAGGNPVSGVRVDYNYGLEAGLKTAKFAQTGSDGTFKIENLSGTLLFDFFIQKQGFDDYRNSKPVSIKVDSKEVVLKLKRKVVVEEKEILVRDGSQTPKREINGQEITSSFECSSGKLIPEKKRFVSAIKVEASELNGCGAITATVLVQGFQPLALPLTSTTTIFDLLPDAPDNGFLRVSVKSSQDNSPLPGIKLTLYSGSTTNAVGVELTDSTGEFTFETAPGNYIVRASDDASQEFETKTSDSVTVSSGETATLGMLLERTPPSNVRFLRIKVVDAASSNPISGALVYFSEDGVLNDTPLTTNNEGKAEYNNARAGKTYKARVKATGYVSFFGTVQLRERSDQDYTVIMLDAATSSNSGKIRVTVRNEEGSNVPEATVLVYNALFESLPIRDETNLNGIADLGNESLPAGSYYAFAEKAALDANGLSDTKQLSAGQTLDLNVTLVAGLANIKVKVVNVSGSPISDVNVMFFESLSFSNFQKKAELSTAANGLTNAVEFKVNKNVKITASKAGFLQSSIIVSRLSKSTADNAMIVELTLYPQNYATDFLIRFSHVSKPNSFERLPAREQKILANTEKEYGMVFDIIVPSGNQSGVKSHVRTDLDSIINEAAARMVVRNASAERSPIRSADYNRSNAFSDQNIVSDAAKNAKQVNLSFGSLYAGAYRFYATVLVKKVAADTVLEIHFTAKSNSKSLGDSVKTFKVGQLFCWENAREQCPNFDYSFEIQRQDSSSWLSLQQVPQGPFDINHDINYTLSYRILNSGTQNITTSFDINFSSSNNALVFGENGETSVLEPWSEQLASGASFSQTIKLRGVVKTQRTEMLLKLGLDMQDTNAKVAFKVSASPLLVSVPNSLFANTPSQELAVRVSDALSGNPIQNALVKVKVSSTELTVSNLGLPDLTAFTDSQGWAFFTLSAFDATHSAFVHSSAPGFEAVLKKVPFSNAFGDVDQFACVKIEPVSKKCSFDDSKICFASTDSTPADFRISTENCSEQVSVALQGGYALQDSTGVSLPVSPATAFTMLETDSKTATVSIANRSPAGILGQIPVYASITGLLTGVTGRKELVTFIGYPGFEKDCFGIGKTEFDIVSGSDSNAAFNYCFLFHSDPDVPSIALRTQLAFALTSQTALQTSFPFQWRVKASVKELVKTVAQAQKLAGVRIPIDTQGNQLVFEGSTTTQVTKSPPQAVSDSIFRITNIRFSSYHGDNVVNEELKKAFINSSSITLTLKDGSTRSISVPCDALKCNWTRSVWETACSGPLTDCTYSYIDIPISPALDINRITASIKSTENDKSFVFFDLNGTLPETTLTYSENSFTTFSQWRDAIVLPGRETGINLGLLNFGLQEVKASPLYRQGRILDINFSIETSKPEVDAWIQGSIDQKNVEVLASYYGSSGSQTIESSATGQREVIPFSIYSNGWQGEAYTVLAVNDYADEAKRIARRS